jgi:protein-L-isoaspartate(D-aspartate) O-methyltransferase
VPTDDPTMLRETLVERVRAHAGTITEPVARAMRIVPRHLFLPGVPVSTAYRDDAIVTKRDDIGRPISSSSQPTIMALMLDQLGMQPGQRVLEIGAGTGYNAALISRLVSPGGSVVSIDIDADVVERARANLIGAGYPEASVVCADGADGFAVGGPYDRIIATVGVWDLAPAWLEQLAPGGRLVVPLDLRGVQRSVAFEPQDGRWTSRSVVPCGFMPLRGSLAGPERSYLLDRDTELSITVPGGGSVDRVSMRTALDGSPAVRSTGTVLGPERIAADLGLWLAIHEPRWCTLYEAETARTLPEAAPDVQGTRVAAGVHSGDSVALLSGGPGGEMVTHGYGTAGVALADDLVRHVRAWDRAGRPGAGLRIDVYPRSGPNVGPAGGVAVDKRYHRFVLSWPPARVPSAGD